MDKLACPLKRIACQFVVKHLIFYGSSERIMRTLKEKYVGNSHRSRQPVTIRTTLYELIETVIDVVGTDKNQMIMPVLLDTLRKGHANVVVSETTIN